VTRGGALRRPTAWKRWTVAILRSLLYTPGNRPKMLEKAPSFGADALIFDLEDTVPIELKPEGRTITAEYI
jgi:citrate lyase subunit beta/citryl-CoA lyase